AHGEWTTISPLRILTTVMRALNRAPPSRTKYSLSHSASGTKTSSEGAIRSISNRSSDPSYVIQAQLRPHQHNCGHRAPEAATSSLNAFSNQPPVDGMTRGEPEQHSELHHEPEDRARLMKLGVSAAWSGAVSGTTRLVRPCTFCVASPLAPNRQ